MTKPLKPRTYWTLLFASIFLWVNIGSAGKAHATTSNEVLVAYYPIVNDLVKEYGIATEQDPAGEGLAYAKLIDLDGDGVSELHIIYLTGDDNYWTGWNYAGFYTHEIWKYQQGKAIKVYSEQGTPAGRHENYTVSLTSASSQVYIINTYSVGNGDSSHESISFHALKNSRLVEVAVLGWYSDRDIILDDNRTTYTVLENNKSQNISEKEYNNLLVKFGYNQRTEIVSSIDSGLEDGSFHFDFVANQKEIEVLLEKLVTTVTPSYMSADELSKLSVQERDQLNTFITNFAGSGNLDMRHYNTDKLLSFLENAIANRALSNQISSVLQNALGNQGMLVDAAYSEEPNAEELAGYALYDAQAINESLNVLFGTTIPLTSGEAYNYEKGYFYIPVFKGDDRGIAEVSSQVTKFVSLGNKMYYVEFLVKMEDRISGADYSTNKGYAILQQYMIGGEKNWNLLTYNADGESISNNDLATLKKDLLTRTTPDSWAKTEVDQAVAAKLVPQNLQGWYGVNMTRAEFSQLIINMLTIKKGQTIDEMLAANVKSIDDFTFNDTEDRSILAAYALGIVGGKGNNSFDPNGNITRQEAAVMLAGTAKLLGIQRNNKATKFTDNSKIASWAKDAVTTVTSIVDKKNQNSVMGTTGDNNFSPTATYTREQAIITIKRLFNAS